MENILSITELLHEVLDDAKKEADKIIADAHKTANEMIAQVKVQMREELNKARVRALHEEKEKIKIESTRILDEYRQKVTSLKNIPERRLNIALDLVINEVLPH